MKTFIQRSITSTALIGNLTLLALLAVSSTIFAGQF